MKEAEQQAIVHPPHVHRLLRLIREGTPSHASRASVLLGRYAASCCAGVSSITTHHDGDGTEDDGTPQVDSNRTASSISNPGLIIWDLIGILVGGDGVTATTNTDSNNNNNGKGKRKRKKDKKRPTSGLFDPNWATRTNCAMALEYVARCLPLEDRRHFFEGDDDDAINSDGKHEDDGEETMLWLNVNELQKYVVGDAKEQSGIKSEEFKQNHLDVVAEQGRLLLSSSGAQYDWDCDGEASEYIREQEALQNLDATATHPTQQQHDDNSMKKELQESFLMRRVKLQRQILARRLGLGGILSAPIVTSHGKTPDESTSLSSNVKKGRVIDDIVADEDLVASFKSKKRKQTASKGDKAKSKAKQPKKRRRAKKSEPEDCGMEVKPTGMNIRALLVLESQRAANDINSCKHTRHRNPQTLLGSELAYRTFDPDWTVRHGALLGTLALLRAWKVHDTTQYSSIANGKDHKKKFGRWPQDILARCICILALDQFADFSGASIDSADDEPIVDDMVSGAIVAPIREMAAQIVTILLEASPSEVADCTHGLLNQLYTRQPNAAKERGSSGWEVRHGVLLTWKYVCAMALFHTNRKEQSQPHQLNGIVSLRPLSTNMKNHNNDLHRCHSIFNNIVLESIRGLSDTSDDNRAVAAQVLRHSLLIDSNLYTVSMAKECSRQLWDAITKIREGVSSCAADLLHLLAELLSRDCESFLSCLRDTMGSFSLNSILQKLAGFICDDSTHVRISCFCALCLVAEPITQAILDGANISDSESNTTHAQSLIDCVTMLCRLINKLFETYFFVQYISRVSNAVRAENKVNDSEAEELSRHRNLAWTATLDSLALLTQSNSYDEGSSCSKIIDDTFADLILRYLGITRAHSHWNDRNNSSKLTRVVDIIGVTDNSFQSKLTSSRAIAQFHKHIYSTTQPTYFTEKIHAILQSPWLSQSEAGTLLHISLTSFTERESTAESKPFFTAYLPYMISTFDTSPTCLLLEDHPTSSEEMNDKCGLNHPDIQSTCDNGLAMLLDSSGNCSSDDIVGIWHQTFASKRIPLDILRKTYTKSTTQASMRLSASISGALVSCGPDYLPSKVTPLIRALMTSLNNEESAVRTNETCRYISLLVLMLSKNSTHERARNKLIESICSTACNRDTESCGPSSGAACVIKYIVANNPDMKLEDFPPINDRLAFFLKELLSDQELSDAVLILEIVSGAMSKESQSFKHVLVSFSKSAVDVACTSKSEFLRNKACASIKHFCSVDFCTTMDLVVPALLPILSNNMHCDKGREGGCELMLTILHGFEVLVAPYVTTLLPVAMRLMTDPLEECARLAASAFAILVRIAPLAANYIGKDESTHSAKSRLVEGCKYASNDVIQHLILGKPLPPCVLPKVVSSELQTSATTLRPYQMEGISWLKFLSDVHLNGALCDDMGLGKTLQSLIAVAVSHHEKSAEETKDSADMEEQKSLVVCPSSVVGHWVSEIGRFFPSNEIFTPFDFTGTAKRRRAAWQEGVQKSNIVVTSYSVLRTDVNLLEGTSWNYCILDEGHLLKNPKTATAKASRRLKARHKLILTGTPIQNNVHEIWATFDFLMPNFLGNESSFLKEFAKPIIKSQLSDASAADIDNGMEALKILHQQVLPFVLRREKSQVIKELPPKIITDIPCSLSKQQSLLYQQTLKKSGMKEALAMIDNSLADAEETPDASGPQLGGDVLASLLQLRLICTHPLLHSLYSSKNNDSTKASSTSSPSHALTRLDCSGKLSALNDLLRHAGIAEPEITAADNDESGYLVDAVGSMDDSSDIDCLVNGEDDALGDIGGDDEAATSLSKCLIFAQFTQSLDIVERLLFEPHMPSLQYLRLDGSVPGNQRSTIVEQFNQDENIKVLLLTTKVGGLGLNLTGADKVIFLEPDWNPFVDLQAMDRAHRIGQTKTVNVYRLITSDTIEEKIMKLQQRKKATSEAVVNTDNSTMFSMGTDRLLDIFTCRGDSRSASGSKEGAVGDDNVLSYLDNDKLDEYSSLTVDGFMRGLS